MKASEGRKVHHRFASLAGLLVALPVAAQTRLPPLPPPIPQRISPHQTNIAASPRVSTPVVTAPAASAPLAPPSPLAPIVVPPPRAPSPGVVSLAPPATLTDPNALKWDAETKEYSAQEGEREARFSFWLTNVSSSEVLINYVRTSCGCTVAKLPSQPWHVAPGAGGPIEVTVNLLGKRGQIAKGITVESSSGVKQLTVKVAIPEGAGGALVGPAAGAMGDADRLKNMQLALADRQVVFKNQECAKCHAEPAKGLTDGRLVYAAVCATCHNSPLRAAMVPDLRGLNHPTDAEHWRKWITYGRPGSMMPAFAQGEGGPLNAAQLDALVAFMVKAFPSRPLPATPVHSAAPGNATALDHASVVPAATAR